MVANEEMMAKAINGCYGLTVQFDILMNEKEVLLRRSNLHHLLVDFTSTLDNAAALYREHSDTLVPPLLRLAINGDDVALTILEQLTRNADVLLAHGAKVDNSRLPNGFTSFSAVYDTLCMFPKVMHRWVEAGADVDEGLFIAVCHGKLDDVRFFLQLGADLNALLHGSTILVHGVMSPLLAKEEDTVAMVRLLIQAGADVDARFDGGGGGGGDGGVDNKQDLPKSSALMNAIASKKATVVKLLLQAGASRVGAPSVLPWRLEGSTLLNDDDDVGQFGEQDGWLGYLGFTHCAGCRKRGREGVLLPACTGCFLVAYCGPECQRAHWSAGHAPICRAKREREAKRRSKVSKGHLSKII